MYNDAAPPADPYSDAYNAPPPAATPASDDRDRPARGRSRSRTPPSRSNGGDYRSPASRRRSPPPPKKPAHAPVAPNPSSVLGVFGLSIRTQERDLDEEFSKFGRVVKVTIVYDQRSDRSRGFGFIEMATVEDAARCIEQLNGVDLNGRRIRVDYSITDRPHAPTPGSLIATRIGTATMAPVVVAVVMTVTPTGATPKIVTGVTVIGRTGGAPRPDVEGIHLNTEESEAIPEARPGVDIALVEGITMDQVLERNPDGEDALKSFFHQLTYLWLPIKEMVEDEH